MISVLIPAYNEADRIGETIMGCKEGIKDYSHELIVIDDGSTDGTAKRARESGAKVLQLARNGGKGTAVNHGLNMAKGDILMLVDADLGPSANLIYHLLHPIQKDDIDLTIAKFPSPVKKGGFGLVKGLAHHGLYFCTGERFHAPISGQRAIKREVIDEIGQFWDGWGMEVAMTIAAHHRGFSIKEVPIELGHRETGRDLVGFLHRGRQFREIGLALLKSYWKYRVKEGGRIK